MIDPVTDAVRVDPRRPAMEAALRALPDLTPGGLFDFHYFMRIEKTTDNDVARRRARRKYDAWRAELLDDDQLAQFDAARRWLAQWRRRKTMNRWGTTYSLKHAAEKDLGLYVSNGAMVAAAVHLGFRIQRDRQTPNAFVNVEGAAFAWRPRAPRCAQK